MKKAIVLEINAKPNASTNLFAANMALNLAMIAEEALALPEGLITDSSEVITMGGNRDLAIAITIDSDIFEANSAFLQKPVIANGLAQFFEVAVQKHNSDLSNKLFNKITIQQAGIGELPDDLVVMSTIGELAAMVPDDFQG